ncbi:magnesium chelatase domain-containing protein [Xylanimonas sp. McL0601]|uniref:magnesium chelatase domain-containing protein n=1 Tax=Xylanimonas sp. McL0601 TaxID=3414739 RepID=UPI003CEC4124
MSLGTTAAIALVGLTGHVVEVQAQLAYSVPGFTLVGLPDTALSESRDRVRAAVLSSKVGWPNRKITVNLSPASLPKHGSGFDLAVAVAVLAGAGELPAAGLERVVHVGELGLDGRLQPVRGVLPMVAAAMAAGYRDVVVPTADVAEASLVPGARVRGATTLADVVALHGGQPRALPDVDPVRPARVAGVRRTPGDLADVLGQDLPRLALEIAAAGGHHLLFTGPPGAGKTMLASRLPGILPDLTEPEAVEVTAVHSVAGTFDPGGGLLARPPNSYYTRMIRQVPLRGKRVVLMYRLSVADDASTAIERQTADLDQVVTAEGWEVVEAISDDGVSGVKNKASIERALGMLRNDEADIIAVWKLDRFTRAGITVLGKLIEVLDENPGTLFVAKQDGLRSDQSTWRLIAGVLAEVARTERENIAMRTTSSIAALRKMGRFAGGRVPYGYASTPNPDGPGFILTVDEQEREVVEFMARCVLGGKGTFKTAQALNQTDWKPRIAGHWSPNFVTQVLTGQAILGRVIHHGEPVCDDDGVPLAVWEPIVELPVWRELQGRLVSTGVPRRKASRLLSGGLVRCGSCGGNMNVNASGRNRKRNGELRQSATYRCGAKSRGQTNCEGMSISAVNLEEYVTELFLASEGDLNMWAEVKGEDVQARALLHEVVEALGRTKDELADAIDEDDDEGIAAIRGQRQRLRAREAELRERLAKPVVRWVEMSESVRGRWLLSDADQRRAMLTDALEPIVIVKGANRLTPIADRATVKVRDDWKRLTRYDESL